jgi:hypothetical protein
MPSTPDAAPERAARGGGSYDEIRGVELRLSSGLVQRDIEEAVLPVRVARSCCSFVLLVRVARSCCSFVLLVRVARSCCSFVLLVRVALER